MTLRVPTFVALGSAAILASCSTTPVQETRSPKAEARLAKELEGRTAGKPVNCISNFRTTNMQVIDDWTILFHEGRTVFVQEPRGGCQGIAGGHYTLVTRQFGTSQMCAGQINNLVDLRTGMSGGACVFGPFTPYTKPR